MKRHNFSTIVFGLMMLSVGFLSGCFGTRVTPVRSGNGRVAAGGVLYALPLTEVCIDITFAHRDTTGAPFVAYASEMLALDDSDEPFRMTDVNIASRVVADPAHYYYVSPWRTSLQVDDRRLLRSVGVEESLPPVQELPEVKGKIEPAMQRPATYNMYDRVDTFYRRGDRPGHPTQPLAKKGARSVRQQALATAATIGELQEKVQSIMEEDDVMQTSTLTQQRVAALNKQIDELTALFVGREREETVRFVVTPKLAPSPSDDFEMVLFFFSPQNGIVERGADDATPVVCRVHCDNDLRDASRFVRFHTGEGEQLDNRNSIKYRASERAVVSVESDYFRFQRILPIAQYGPVLELPRGSIKARFDDATGELIYLAK